MNVRHSEISLLSEELFDKRKNQIDGTQKPINIQLESNQKNIQKCSKMLSFNKGQQNQSYLTSLIFKNSNIDNISVEIKPFNECYVDLMSIIEQRTAGDSKTVQMKAINNKKQIVDRQKQDIDQMNSFKIQYLDKNSILSENSYQLFQNLMNVLQNKICEISEMEKEVNTISQQDEKFVNEVQSMKLDCYDQVHNLLSQIKTIVDNKSDPAMPNNQIDQRMSQNQNINPSQMNYQQRSNQDNYSQDESQNRENNQMRMRGEHMGQNNAMQIRGNLVRDNLKMECEDMQINEQIDQNQMKNDQMKFAIEDNQRVEGEKKYNLQQLDTFFQQVNPDDVEAVYKMFTKLQLRIEQLERDFQRDVSNPLQKKRQVIAQLFQDVQQKVHSQIINLPLNYFAMKQQEVLEYYSLPSYSDQNVNIQQFEQQQKDKNLSIVAYKIKFSLEDLRRLTKDQLINDNLLDCYAQYLRDANRHMKKTSNYQLSNLNMTEIIIFSHLFFETQYDSMRIKTQEAKQFIDQIYPVGKICDPNFINRFGFIVNVDLHNIKHWIFLGVFNQTREIVYYDSAAGNTSYFKNMTSALIQFFQQNWNITYVARKFEKCPRQQNGTDCGMFVLKYMQNFAYDTEQNFDQDHITQLRQKLYTFFPLLSYQQSQKKIDYEILQYFEGRIQTMYDEKYKPMISKALLNI